MSVTLTTEPGKVGYEVVMSTNWDTYGGQFKGWRASEDHHHIMVPFDWRTRVLKRGLASAGDRCANRNVKLQCKLALYQTKNRQPSEAWVIA